MAGFQPISIPEQGFGYLKEKATGATEMRAIPDSYVSRVLFALPRPACGFEAVASRWRRLKTTLLDPYRPELHYMRGPGPKWREKHAPYQIS